MEMSLSVSPPRAVPLVFAASEPPAEEIAPLYTFTVLPRKRA